MFGWTELLIIFGVLVIIFGASRIPEVARSLGESVDEFKSGMDDNPESLPEDEPEQAQDVSNESSESESKEES
jgi:sec-independent protein translocase protein TatA